MKIVINGKEIEVDPSIRKVGHDTIRIWSNGDYDKTYSVTFTNGVYTALLIPGNFVHLAEGMIFEVKLATQLDTQDWNLFEITLPSGETFKLAFKDHTLRIRKPGWKPLEAESGLNEETKRTIEIDGEYYSRGVDYV